MPFIARYSVTITNNRENRKEDDSLTMASNGSYSNITFTIETHESKQWMNVPFKMVKEFIQTIENMNK